MFEHETVVFLLNVCENKTDSCPILCSEEPAAPLNGDNSN